MRLLLCAMALVWGLSVQASEWIDALDLPLMEGLNLDQDAATIFETATGRVVIVEAEGTIATAAVERYYAAALSGLGWARTTNMVFTREAERLEIETTEQDGVTSVAFRLAPR